MATTSTERMRALRARRAAALTPDPAAPTLRDADDLLAPAVAETIAALDLGPEHAAAVKLAERIAAAMDSARDPSWAARWLGPELLRCLAELGATPQSRHAITKGLKPPQAVPGRLAALRAMSGPSDRP